jgi:hypothetical protein
MPNPTPEQLAELSRLYNLHRAIKLHLTYKKQLIENKQREIYDKLRKEKEDYLADEVTALDKLSRQITLFRLSIGRPANWQQLYKLRQK